MKNDLPTPSGFVTEPGLADLCRTHPDLHYRPATQQGREILAFGQVCLEEIALQVGTPCWVINADILRNRARRFKAAFAAFDLTVRHHFAVKAQDHLAVLTVLHQEGFGADIVSGGELQRSLTAGMAPGEIVFSGIGKTDAELREAIALEIAQINVESAEELERINHLAGEMGRSARIALRVNPDIDAGTHDKITTGRAEDKFGIQYADIIPVYRRAMEEYAHLHPVGLAVHLGSQILSAEPYRKGYERLAGIVRDLRQAGLTVSEIDCGGGLGIAYRDELAPEPALLAEIIAQTLGPLDVTLRVEPGRFLAGPAGVLLAGITEIKAASHQHAREFVILDAGMTELIRPALYESWHGILPLQRNSELQAEKKVDLVGPICESSDVFARQRLLPPLKRGEIVALLDAGAYGSVMSSHYNTRPLATQVMSEGKDWSIIRPRQSVEELLSAEMIPSWLASTHLAE